MAKLMQIEVDGVKVHVWPLEGQLVEDATPWYNGFLELQEGETIAESSDDVEDDLIFEYEPGKFCLLPAPAPADDAQRVDFNRVFTMLASILPSEATSRRYARISAAYRRRVLEAAAADERDDSSVGADALLPEASQASASSSAKPGIFKSREAPVAIAGGITLTNFLADRFRDPNSYMGGDKLLGSLSINSVVVSAVVLPYLALMATYTMVYATNVAAYMAENNGKFPDKDARTIISNDSFKKGFQTGVGFALIEAVRPVIEDILGESIQTAWSTASSSLGGVTAAVYPAIMLTVSLAVGLGMAVGSVAAQYVEKRTLEGEAGKINFGEVFQAFTIGLFAGAVSTIDFGNKGFSFMATWAALSLVPAAKVAANVGSEREEFVDSLTAVRGTVSHLWKRTYTPVEKVDAVKAAEELGAKNTGDTPRF